MIKSLGSLHLPLNPFPFFLKSIHIIQCHFFTSTKEIDLESAASVTIFNFIGYMTWTGLSEQAINSGRSRVSELPTDPWPGLKEDCLRPSCPTFVVPLTIVLNVVTRSGHVLPQFGPSDIVRVKPKITQNVVVNNRT